MIPIDNRQDPPKPRSTTGAAVRTNPKLGEAHNNLAVVYMSTGRLEDAEQAMKRAEQAGFKVNPQLKKDIESRKKS